MKNKLVILNGGHGFVFLITGFLACTPSSSNHQSTHKADSTEVVLNQTQSESDQGQSFVTDKSRGMLRQEAIDFTNAYYANPNPSGGDKMAKSIHFKGADLEKFLADVKAETNLCPSGELGYRFYFAKYPEGHSSGLGGQHTVIIRATCDGKDIGHQVVAGSETKFIAYNFGDVCPPLCDLSNPNTPFPGGGKYNPDGNCFGCPQ